MGLIWATAFLQIATLDHSAWNTLLTRYVNAQSRVDYQRWKAADIPALDGYLLQLAAPWPSGITAQERKAALINAYNALTVRWILRQYPVPSVWATPKPFVTPRHIVDAKKVSLDGIETQLRNLGDPRVHAVLVCAARSCPPLRREAYSAERLDAQLDDNARAWLASPALNEFFPAGRLAKVSPIFEWYAKDFPSVPQFLAAYAPVDERAFLREPGLKIEFKQYHWGLNDTAPLGLDYGGLRFLWDYIWNKR